MQVKYRKIELPFHHPFTISKGTKTHQPTLLVELDYFGVKGYGEAPAINYYNITVDQMIADIERKKPFIEKFSFADPERYWHYLHHLFPANPFLVNALDMAGWDIFGKMRRKQLHEIWNLNTAIAPLTDYTIGIDTPQKMIEKIKEKPWPIYKIKVGFENDVDTVAELRNHTDAIFRVDANAGWTLDEALNKIPVLQALGVELIEQPLAKDQFDEMETLYNYSALPLFADESCVTESDVDKCIGRFHGINIKLTKCSGITPARRMIAQAKNAHLKIMIGCMNEASIGSAAIAQLAPLVDYIDMDGPLLLKEDIASGLSYDHGKIIYSTLPGLGVEVDAF
ncbi:MAG: dipeptide epimerase [Ferruginibacter sp.]